MGDFFSFKWLNLKPREIAFHITKRFGGLDAGRDRCLYPDCGVERKVHGKAHRFVEKAP